MRLTRVALLLTCSLLFCLSAFGQATLDANPVPSTPTGKAGPESSGWGLVSTIDYIVGAWEFESYSSAGPHLTGSSGNRTGTTAAQDANLHLPAGAQVIGIEIQGCDNSTTSEIVAVIYSVNQAGAVTVRGEARSGVAGTGCGYFASSTFTPYTIDNYFDIHAIELFPGATTNAFSGVRIYYKLQVSPAPASASFTDVPTTHPFYQFVEALRASGITGGCTTTPPQFCPNDFVTRGQMAAFLARALGLHFPH